MGKIQWFPGHMAKAKRQLTEKLPLVDIVFELVDARIPDASRNPDLMQLIENKPSILILMKPDLADPNVTNEWLSYYREQGITALTFNGKSDREIPKLIEAAEAALTDHAAKRESKGLLERAMRAVTVGVPNVGKSTLINRFAGKNITRTGNRPGMTQAQQWIKYKKQVELLDIPGILWPKFEDQEVGNKLALTGAIKDQLLLLDDIAMYGITQLRTAYPEALSSRFDLTEELLKNGSASDILIEITRNRGFQEDYERGAEKFIHELRNGKIGRFTFDNIPTTEEKG